MSRWLVALTSLAAIVGIGVGAFQLRDYIFGSSRAPVADAASYSTWAAGDVTVEMIRSRCAREGTSPSVPLGASTHPLSRSRVELEGAWCFENATGFARWRLAIVSADGKVCIYDRVKDVFSSIRAIEPEIGDRLERIVTDNRVDLSFSKGGLFPFTAEDFEREAGTIPYRRCRLDTPDAPPEDLSVLSATAGPSSDSSASPQLMSEYLMVGPLRPVLNP